MRLRFRAGEFTISVSWLNLGRCSTQRKKHDSDAVQVFQSQPLAVCKRFETRNVELCDASIGAIIRHSGDTQDEALYKAVYSFTSELRL